MVSSYNLFTRMDQPSQHTIVDMGRCTRRKSNGDQCGKLAIIGSTVCRAHGGSSESVRRAAAERLVLALPLCVEKIVSLLSDSTEQPCPLCGRGMPRREETIIRVANLECMEASKYLC